MDNLADFIIKETGERSTAENGMDFAGAWQQANGSKRAAEDCARLLAETQKVGEELSALSFGDDLWLMSAAHLRGASARSDLLVPIVCHPAAKKIRQKEVWQKSDNKSDARR